MRLQLFVLSVGLAAVGCGGGSDKPKLPDAKVFMDAAIDAAPVCSVGCDNPNFCGEPPSNSSMFPALVLGQQMRASGDWFFQPTQGPLMGRTVFQMALILSPQGASASDVIFISAVKPQAGNFQLDTPQPLDPNPALSANTQAYSFFIGDAVIVNGQIQSAAQEYWGKDGVITLTAIGETDGQNIDGTMAVAAGNPPTPVNYAEIDMNGAEVAGGCTASIAFEWHLTQMASMPFDSVQDPTSNAFYEKHGYRAPTKTERDAINNYMHQRFGL